MKVNKMSMTDCLKESKKLEEGGHIYNKRYEQIQTRIKMLDATNPKAHAAKVQFERG